MLEPATLSTKEIKEFTPKELSSYVSLYIGTYKDQPIYFDKKIIIKDDNFDSLESRITELLRFEDTKKVIFGVFTSPVNSTVLIEMFEAKSKEFIRAAGRQKAIGRIWVIELNGTVKGCGVIAADDTISAWRDL